MLDDIQTFVPEAAELLKAAKENAAKQPPAPAVEKGPEPLKPEVIVERYNKLVEDEEANFNHGIAPVVSYVQSKHAEKFGKTATPEEWKATPEVALLKDLKHHVLEHGFGDLPSFREGFAKWGDKREMKGKEFTPTLQRVGKFATAGDKVKAAEAGKELISFADAYDDERAAHPLISYIDNLIAIAAGAANVAPRVEGRVPGGHVSQPATPNGKGSLDDYLVADALSR